MLVFPQLSSGAAALYPLTRTIGTRTVVNTLGDGSAVVFADEDAGRRDWELRASGLTGAEWAAIESLFVETRGRWSTFALLDPAGNLLARSEEFGAAGWTSGSLIALTAGIDDPFGTARATRAVNTGVVAEAVLQEVAGPGNFRYALSVWARTTGESSLTLTGSTAGGSVSRVFALTAEWQRISMVVALGLSTDSVTVGAQLDGGATVDLFGMQLEAQPGVSDYKRNGASRDLYSSARFAEDQLTVKAQGMDVFDAVIRITSGLAGLEL